MAMVVQHNMQAMNSSRMLGITTNAQAKSTEKLSSGYKINRAADDAAGLSISEKMRKQMRGLDRASTSTNSQSDRESIQNEVDQLTTEIDRVSETTKFNEMYLLKGNSDPTQTKTVTMNGHDAGLDKLRDATNYATEIAGQNDASKTQFEFTVKADSLKAGTTVNIGGKDYTIIDKNDTKYGEYTKDKGTGVMKNGVLAQDDTKITGARAMALIRQALGQANYIGDKGTAKSTLVDTKSEADGATATVTAANVTAKSGDIPTDLTGTAVDMTFKVTKAKNEVQQALNFNLHVGADADMNNKIGVGIEAMNSKYLGVKGLDVVGKDSSGNNKDDGGIANNVDNVVENTTSAESRIRDTDMADEMVTYSKNNILAQAGQSMLAQANQSTQGVLSLLG